MGVEPQSETVWRQADKYGVPRICFINKINQTGGDFWKSLDSIHQRLSDRAFPIHLPIGFEQSINGVVDLIMLDLNMPVRDGWQTFQTLSRDYPLLPIIIITARSNQRFPALAAGVGALMEKPLDFPHLLETIRALLEEPAEARLARVSGRLSQFHFYPSA